MVPQRNLVAVLGAALVALAAQAARPTTAYAEKPYMRPRFSLRGGVGFGGQAVLNGDIDYDDDLQATAGVITEVEVPLARWYSIGAEVGAHAWRTDLADDFDIDRNILIDMSMVNRLRLAWGEHSHGAFYVAAPIGATVSIARGGYGSAAGMAAGTGPIDLGAGGGLHVGGRLGIQLFLGKVFGFTFEGGYDYRLLRHEVDGGDHVQVRFGQWVLQGGVAFAF
jgi:hypothetical protein